MKLTKKQRRGRIERERRKKYLNKKHRNTYLPIKVKPPKVEEIKVENPILKKKNMKFLKLFQSRTFWTIIVMFIINGFAGIRMLLPPGWLPVIDGILSVLALYFHANPRVNFNQ